MQLKNIIKIWKEVFGKSKYIVISLVTMIIFYVMVVFFANFKILLAQNIFTTVKNFPSLLTSYPGFVPKRFFLGTMITSLLVGILFGLISYQTKMIRPIFEKSGIFASFGTFFGVLAPGCPSCAIGILSVLGISSAFLASLPFKGFEFSVLAILILSFSIYKISIKIGNGIVCKIKPDKKALKGGIKNE